MYAPPPSYTNATVATAETVSSASDKSDTVHFSSDDSTSKPSFILEGNMETNVHYQQAHSTLPTFYHDDSCEYFSSSCTKHHARSMLFDERQRPLSILRFAPFHSQERSLAAETIVLANDRAATRSYCAPL